MHAIACVILMIGLLKFAQDAPDLLKTLFSNGSSLLKGMNLNPKGQLKNDISGAAKTAVGAGKLGAGIGKGAAGAVTGFGKGAVGAFAGAKNGFRTGKGSEGGLGGFFHGMAGGARGMVAGGSAGAHHVGFKGTGSAAAFAGAGAGRKQPAPPRKQRTSKTEFKAPVAERLLQKCAQRPLCDSLR